MVNEKSWITSQRQCEAWLSKTHDHQRGWGGGLGAVATAATGVSRGPKGREAAGGGVSVAFSFSWTLSAG